MIAANLRKFPEAQMAQMELDLSGTVGTDEVQRASFWSWLMNTGKVLALPGLPRPAWWVAARCAAQKLAKAVKMALLPLNFWKE